MANYNIVAESSFTPFTFEELLKPAMMASEAHLQMEKEYDTLQEQASTLEKLANQSRNTAEYNTYKQFSEDLKSQADALASQGLTQTGRQGIRNLRTKYREQLVPIQEAMQSIEKRAEEQRKLRASNPNLMFDRYFDSDVSIKDMMDNPNLSYNPVSGDDLYKKGIAAGKAASQRMFKDPVLKDQFYQIEQGYGKEAALQFLKDHSSIEELNESIKDIMSSSGANNLSEADITRATDFIVRGMFDGMDYDVKHIQKPKTASEELNPYQKFIMKSQGYNPVTGDIDTSSPYWVNKGITFDKDGNPIPVEEGDNKQEKATVKILPGRDQAMKILPNGDIEFIDLPPKSSEEKKGTVGYDSEGNLFPGVQFKMYNEKSSTQLLDENADFQQGFSNKEWGHDVSHFEEGEQYEISINDFSPAMRSNIESMLRKFNLKVEDVVIEQDKDPFSDDHFRIRLKTDDEYKKSFTSNKKPVESPTVPADSIRTATPKDTVVSTAARRFTPNEGL